MHDFSNISIHRKLLPVGLLFFIQYFLIRMLNVHEQQKNISTRRMFEKECNILFTNTPRSFKSNGAHRLLVYNDDINLLFNNINNIKRYMLWFRTNGRITFLLPGYMRKQLYVSMKHRLDFCTIPESGPHVVSI